MRTTQVAARHVSSADAFAGFLTLWRWPLTSATRHKPVSCVGLVGQTTMCTVISIGLPHKEHYWVLTRSIDVGKTEIVTALSRRPCLGPVVGCLPCCQTADTGVILMQITDANTDNGAARRQARTVGCQSKSQGTRYRLGLIVYDIVAVKIFDRYRNIALSIRALVYL